MHPDERFHRKTLLDHAVVLAIGILDWQAARRCFVSAYLFARQHFNLVLHVNRLKRSAHCSVAVWRWRSRREAKYSYSEELRVPHYSLPTCRLSIDLPRSVKPEVALSEHCRARSFVPCSQSIPNRETTSQIRFVTSRRCTFRPVSGRACVLLGACANEAIDKHIYIGHFSWRICACKQGCSCN